MLRAEESTSRVAPDPAPARPDDTGGRGGLRPALAFLLMLLLIVAVGAIVYLTRPNAPTATASPPATSGEARFQLTNEEAITRFQELAELRSQAFATADVSLLSSLYTHDSRVRALAQKELQQLRRDGVSDVSLYDGRRLSVLSNHAREITLREVVVVHPKFVDDKGRDVSTNRDSVREVVVWMLQLEGARWLIHDALITKSTRL